MRTMLRLPGCTWAFTVRWTRQSHTRSSTSGTGRTCNSKQLLSVSSKLRLYQVGGGGTSFCILHQKFKFPKNQSKTKTNKKSKQESSVWWRRRKGAGSSQVLRGRRAASSSRWGRGEGLHEAGFGVGQWVNYPQRSFSTSKMKRVSHRGGGGVGLMTRQTWIGIKAGNGRGQGAVSFGGFEWEGELGPGLALAQDNFLLLLLLLLTVLLQLHALLVNLSLLLHNTQLFFSLSHKTTQTVRLEGGRRQSPNQESTYGFFLSVCIKLFTTSLNQTHFPN